MKRKLSLIMAIVMTLTMVFGYVGNITSNASEEITVNKIPLKDGQIEMTKKDGFEDVWGKFHGWSMRSVEGLESWKIQNFVGDLNDCHVKIAIFLSEGRQNPSSDFGCYIENKSNKIKEIKFTILQLNTEYKRTETKYFSIKVLPNSTTSQLFNKINSKLPYYLLLDTVEQAILEVKDVDMSDPADKAEIESLKKQIEELKKQIEELKNRQVLFDVENLGTDKFNVRFCTCYRTSDEEIDGLIEDLKEIL